MSTAIRFGAGEALRLTRALDGLDLEVRTRSTGSSAPTAPARPPPSVLLGFADGQAEQLGGDPWRDAVALHRRLAYVPGDVALWPNLSGGEVIDLFGRLRGGLDPFAAADLLERSTWTRARRPAPTPRANRQKVALIAALASDVELLLDEPTSGLDHLDGGPLPGGHRRRARQRAHGAAAPATSWPRPRPCATGSASSAPAARWSRAPWPSCVTSPGPRSPSWPPRPTAGRAGRRARPGGGRHAGVLPGRRRAPRRGASGICRRPGCAA